MSKNEWPHTSDGFIRPINLTNQNPVRALKGIVHPKMKTWMHFFFKRRYCILENVCNQTVSGLIDFHCMDKNYGSPRDRKLFGDQHSSSYVPSCSTEERHSYRFRKWWQNVHFLIKYPFNLRKGHITIGWQVTSKIYFMLVLFYLYLSSILVYLDLSFIFIFSCSFHFSLHSFS